MTKKAKPATTLADLTPDPQNARKHNARNIGQVQNSLQKYGAARSIVIDENNQIIAGHGVVEAAALAGIERVQVVEADGETIVAVRRTGLTRKQKQELGIADNRAGDLSEWDGERLAELMGEIDMSQFFRDDELARITGTAPDIDQLWKGMPEFEHEDQTAQGAFTIRVFLKDADDLAALGRLLGKDLTGKKFVWFSKQPMGTTYEAYDGPEP